MVIFAGWVPPAIASRALDYFSHKHIECKSIQCLDGKSGEVMINFKSMEAELRERVRSDEAMYGSRETKTDSLWGHLERVAGFAEKLGIEEGLDPVACRLAGLFHDAGKFAGGSYHDGDIPE